MPPLRRFLLAGQLPARLDPARDCVRVRLFGADEWDPRELAYGTGGGGGDGPQDRTAEVREFLARLRGDADAEDADAAADAAAVDVIDVDGEPIRRSLPPLLTAYPRKSQVFEDPERGLASIEALYAAVRILYGPRPELLEGYRWGDEFLRMNPSLA